MNHDDDNKRIVITKVYGYKQTDAEGMNTVPKSSLLTNGLSI